MSNFKNISALGLEISECLAQGADFRGANFMNMITTRSWFCSAYITKTNLSYANFSSHIRKVRTVGKSLEWHCDNWRRVSDLFLVGSFHRLIGLWLILLVVI